MEKKKVFNTKNDKQYFFLFEGLHLKWIKKKIYI